MQLTKTGTRTSSGTTATDGWLYFRFSDQSSVGANYNITAVYAKFTAIRSASGAFTGDVPVRLVTSGGDYDLGEITGYTFPANTDTSGTTISGYLTASESTLSALRTATIERIDLGQSTYNGGKDIRCLASSTAEFTIVYEENISYTYCGAPSNPTLSVSQTTESAELSWEEGSDGINNAVTGYVITYQDSADGSDWGEADYYDETSDTSITVDAPRTVGYYRRFGIQTMGTAGEDWYSPVVWSGSLKKISVPSALPVWYNGTQLTSITVVKNGVSTKITSLTVVKHGTSTKLF